MLKFLIISLALCTVLSLTWAEDAKDATVIEAKQQENNLQRIQVDPVSDTKQAEDEEALLNNSRQGKQLLFGVGVGVPYYPRPYYGGYYGRPYYGGYRRPYYGGYYRRRPYYG